MFPIFFKKSYNPIDEILGLQKDVQFNSVLKKRLDEICRNNLPIALSSEASMIRHVVKVLTDENFTPKSGQKLSKESALEYFELTVDLIGIQLELVAVKFAVIGYENLEYRKYEAEMKMLCLNSYKTISNVLQSNETLYRLNERILLLTTRLTEYSVRNINKLPFGEWHKIECEYLKSLQNYIEKKVSLRGLEIGRQVPQIINGKSEAEKPRQDEKNTLWFKVGLLFATGEIKKLLDRHKSYSAIARALENKNYRPYMTATAGALNRGGDKNIYNDGEKVKALRNHCIKHNIQMDGDFLKIFQSISNT